MYAAVIAAVSHCLTYIVVEIPFWSIYTLCFLFPIAANAFYEKIENSLILKKTLDEYNKKPYRNYEVELECQHCTKVSPINMTLDDSEYSCKHCGNRNLIHTHFSVFAISETLKSETVQQKFDRLADIEKNEQF
jgi:DNA-directed RNA polymerase subunit RPC12/RpoP